MPSKDTARVSALNGLLLRLRGVVPGKMFGYPAYYVRGRLFACVYGKGVGVKLPAADASELLTRKHIVPFRPRGRPKMREWIQINRANPADYRKDVSVFRKSVAFVRRSPRRKK